MANANAGNGLIKQIAKVVTIVAAAIWKQGDIGIFGPWFGVCLNDAAIGAQVSVDIEAGPELDLVSAAAVAVAVGDAVYYNPTTGAFAAVPTADYYKVGYTTVIKNTDNVFRIEKVRYAKSYTAETFAGLVDVDVAGVTNNDTLKFVTATGKWTDVAAAD